MQPNKGGSPLRRLLMRKSRRKDEPEKKPAALDAAGFDKLEASLNELSKAAATQSLTYLLLWLYLFFTVTAVTDYDLLIENPIKLPIFNLEIGLLAFFIAAPPLFWLVQLYMVRKLAVIREAVGEYLKAAEQQAESAGADSLAVLERLRHRADGFVITRLLARFDDIVLSDGRRGPPSSDLAAALTVLAAGATLVVAPLLLYFGFQIRFLAHQTEWITWQHRGWVLAGLVLCAVAGRTAKLSWGETLRALLVLLLHLVGLIRLCRYLRLPDRWIPAWLARPLSLLFRAAPVAILGLASLTVLTFPGETMSEDERLAEWGMGGDLAERVGVPRTLTPKAPFDREAVADALGDESKPGKLDNAGPPPLDLRHRDFSYRSLRGINLAGARFQGANFKEAQLQSADLFGAQLQGANLFVTQLWGAALDLAQLQGAYLQHAQLHGADLTGAQLQGAYLGWVQLQGAYLGSAQLQGAYLVQAQLQGAYLVQAQLQGANLSETAWWRAEANETAWWRAEANETTRRLATINIMESDYVYFPPPIARNGDAEPDSPDKYRPLVQESVKGILQGRNRARAEINLRRLTEFSDPDKDQKNLQEIYSNLQFKSGQTTPQQRADYLADMACRHSNGKFIFPNIILRSNNKNDVSASVLSERLKDADSCPAAKELTAYDWERLANAVEHEKAVTAPR
jgi:uncharacterized protein YjbI with pentapeptide repeats